MSTPPNKRDARREARLANQANIQSARRIPKPSDETPPEDAEPIPAEDLTVASSALSAPTSAATSPIAEGAAPADVVAEAPIGTDTSMSLPAKATPPTPSKTPTRPTLPTGGRPPAGASKTPTRPTSSGTGATAPKTASSGAPKTPTRPVATSPNTPAARPVVASGPVNTAAPKPATTPAPKAAPAIKAPTNVPPATPAASAAPKTPTRPTSTTAGTTGTPKTPTRPTGTPSGARPTGAKPPTRPTGNTAAQTPTRQSSATRASHASVAPEDAEPSFKTKRDVRREDRLASITRVRQARAAALRKKKQRALLVRYSTIAAIVLAFILIAVLVGVAIHNAAPVHHTPPAKHTTAQIYGQGIACEPMEEAAVHYHANLQIIVNGQNEALPADIGFSPDPTNATCLYWLHTHDTSGVIHIEAPQGSANRAFVLGDFFAVWSQTPSTTIAAGTPELSATDFFGHPVDAAHPLHVFVNGKPYTGDPNLIVLSPHVNIWLEYGTQIVTPTSYTWPAGL
jgi:hypothetical protein